VAIVTLSTCRAAGLVALVLLFTGMTLSLAALAAAQNGPQPWLSGRAILDVDSSIFSHTTAVVPAWRWSVTRMIQKSSDSMDVDRFANERSE